MYEFNLMNGAATVGKKLSVACGLGLNGTHLPAGSKSF